jgi:hypothetical protein
VVDTCSRWLQAGTASVETHALVRHALRSLVKKGDRGALAVLGADARAKIEVSGARFSKRRVRVGEKLEFSFTLQSTASRVQDLIVDYAVHFVKANGSARPKVFKLKRATRQHYPGRHRIELLANGQAFPLGELELLTPARS